MKILTRNIFVLGTLALLGTTHNASAQTILSGHYDNVLGNGYEATASGSPYTVTPTATFNNNGNIGLNVTNATVTVNGGQFSYNENFGLFAVGSQLTINGGTFIGTDTSGQIGLAADTSSVTINGGTFTGNNYALEAFPGSNFTLTGGNFSGNFLTDLFNTDSTATVTLYGSDFTYNGISNYFGTITGTGSFSGKLENNAAVQTLNYDNRAGGTITLARVPGGSAVPEPGSVALLVGMATVGVSILRKRRK